MIKRPSKKELFNKIREAKEVVLDGRIEIVDAVSLAADAIELGYDITTELQVILDKLLNDISADHYTGLRPPQKSYETAIQKLELFAFVVESEMLENNVYLKFALSGGALWLVSFHKDRPFKKGE
ncbi:MAG: hypothetical protein PF482_00730 [Desulfobacteraceae bacterium]|jgi:hypothetical protein|nr:hypothetical protein [Desulfobacteraceae bacterium]